MPYPKHIPYLSALPVSALRGKRVLVRVDLNVPLEDGVVVDDFRIRKVLPTIDYLLRECAHLTIAAHLGDDGSEDIDPVHRKLLELLSHEGEVKITMLPNLRANPGEISNDPQFAEELAKKADIYINEAFSVSHREHASIVGVPNYLPSYAGFLFEQEVKNLSRALAPVHPFAVIIGGVKFKTKIPLAEKFLLLADQVFVSGALCIDFFRAKGYEMGRSVASVPPLDLSGFLANPKISLPRDLVTDEHKTKLVTELLPGEAMLDVGPGTIDEMKEKLRGVKMILWNGPLGDYELGFVGGTDALARIIAGSPAFSIVGGGDTVASLEKLQLLDRFGFVSTAGGAMLDFLAYETLPGIEALIRKRKV